jgi:hypothetical protein
VNSKGPEFSPRAGVLGDELMALTQFPAMLFFSFLVSVVFGVIAKDTPRERVIYGAKVFAAFVGIAILLGWIMYPFPL